MIFESTIQNTIQRTPSIKSIQIPRPQGFDFKAGQFVRFTIKVDGEEQSKYLTISCSPTQQDHLEVTKRITGSAFSKALDQLKAGDWVKIDGPLGRFTLEQSGDKIAFLSGGIGITPIMSICSFCAEQQLDKDIVLLFGNRSIEEIPFRQEFDKMQACDKNLRVVHTLDQAQEGWSGRVGFINADMIKQEVPDYLDRSFFVCGPPKMVDVMVSILIDGLQLPKAQVVKEVFPGY